MAKSYADYEREEKAKAKAAGAQFAVERRQAAKGEIADTLENLNLAAEPKEQEYRKQIAGVPASYQPTFSKNAVEKAVSYRRMAEQLANLGLTHSGISKEMASGFSRQKQAADRAASGKEQADTDRLNQTLSAYLSQLEAQKKAKASAISDKAEKDISAYQQKQMKDAAATALTRYKADQADELACYKAQHSAAKKKG